METSILIGLVTCTTVILLARRLFAAVLDPTPAGAVLLISSAYLVGAMLVEWRERSAMASFVYWIYALHFGMFLLGYFGFSTAFGLRQYPALAPTDTGRNSVLPLLGKWTLLIVVLGTSLLAVYVTGADRLLAALLSFVVGGDSDDSVLDLRLGLASGEQGWMAPGYIKQIRDVLLPLAALFVLFSIRRSALAFLALAFTLIPLASAVMISSGQRAPVLLFLIAAIYAARRAVSWKVQRLVVVAAPVLGFALVGIASFLALTSSFSARHNQDTNAAVVLADRVVTRLPEENVLSAPYWSRGAPVIGGGWMSELASVLPGTQKTLSSNVHEYLGGREQGNSALGAWVAVNYNFGWPLGMAVSVLIGFALAIFNHWVNTARRLSPAADLCGMWISVCMLLVISPFSFLLYGPFIGSGLLALMSATHYYFPNPRSFRSVSAARG